MAGHVFIIRGDLRRLACDAWLMPSNRHARPGEEWFLPGQDGPRVGQPFVEGESRVQPLDAAAQHRPRPWLAHVAGYKRPAAWYAEAGLEFLERAASAIVADGHAPLFGRVRSLLALPIIGTGRGGAAARAGEVVQELLPRLEQFVARTFDGGREFDVVLVCWDAASHAAAQAERVRRMSWPRDVTDNLRTEAERLAGHALRGELALFLGAGVSMAAGLPGWGELLDELATRAGMSAEERRALAELRNALDQATVLERRLQERGEQLGQAVAAVLGPRKHYALTHALLAALPIREVITTNYDQLFECAWWLTDPDGLSVLPGTIRTDSRRWLLKMHGCLADPDRIVLTRADYTRYDQRLPALTGIVQAFLITRHVLFVGFSLTDDNFHRIVDAVRRLRDATSLRNQFGTTLTLGHGGLSEILWEQDVRRVRMDERSESSFAFPSAAASRQLEIFLDYLVSRTRDTAHLLVGERFDALLTPGEQQLRDALTQLLRNVTEEMRSTVAWPHIEQMLRRLGFELPRRVPGTNPPPTGT